MHEAPLPEPTATSGFGRLLAAINAVGAAWVLVLMALLLADVVMRGLFNDPIVGVDELLTISVVAMLYLQVPQALRDNRHTRSDAFYSAIQRRSPRSAAVMELAFSMCGAFLLGAVVWAGVPKVMTAYDRGFTIGTPGVFSVPEWPLNLIIVFGCLLMAIQFVIMAFQSARLAFGQGRLPADAS